MLFIAERSEKCINETQSKQLNEQYPFDHALCLTAWATTPTD